MIGRFLMLLWLCLSLAGCAAWPGGQAGNVAAAPGQGQYHFGWRLSGNRAVAPLQVFDDGARTWLQFAAGQPIPAVFARSAQGDRLLAPMPVQGGFHVLDGVWPHLVVRGGQWQTHVQRLGPGTATQALPGGAATSDTALAAGAAVSLVVPVATADLPADATQATPDLAPLALPVPGTSVTPQPSPAAAQTVFRVDPTDGTLRAALSRWADQAGWTFQPEHWNVDADIPIDGAADFTLPFAQAVQALVGSTELSDYPLQPCFYSNRVLRIVPYAQTCGRAAAGSAAIAPS